jgi:3'-phosphoadenosine 5'-phosphosulfate sulfotransferase (PAPS reductase)/FAD synthetase
MTENEFLLEDRIAKIRSVIEKYGEDNFYLSFSGGKDSTVLSHLIDMALPENRIPRVYANTGIEYRKMLEFVEREREKDHLWELIMLKPSVPIKPTLEEYGYPFKSKSHSAMVALYQKYKTTDGHIGLQHYLHISTDGVDWNSSNSCPKKLKYQFTPEFQIKISDKCCLKMKEEPLEKWAKENNKAYSILGLMREEGGRRKTAQCLAFKGKKFKSFQPLAPLSSEWEEWFIEEYKIELCDLYLPPYNFDRTGCKGCPFAIGLQQELEVLQKFFPDEKRQCEYIWKPVYEEYRRIGYRLKQQNEECIECEIEGQMDVFKWLEENE